ncbi:MAG: acetyl-CoA carboxylase biotin carboxyl carrier protein, partial [Burkholderiaceae bacterium]
MDLRKLKTLIDLVAESDIAELEVTEGESKVRILKSSPAPQQQMVVMQPQSQSAAAPAPM